MSDCYGRVCRWLKLLSIMAPCRVWPLPSALVSPGQLAGAVLAVLGQAGCDGIPYVSCPVHARCQEHVREQECISDLRFISNMLGSWVAIIQDEAEKEIKHGGVCHLPHPAASCMRTRRQVCGQEGNDDQVS